MYKTVQEITHPKIGIKHLPSAQMIVFYRVVIHPAYMYVTSLERHSPLNIYVSDLLSFPAALTSCAPAQGRL